MNRILLTMALAIQVLFCLSCSSRASIGEEEYMDKLRGGWVGKIIGVQLGQPHEFHFLSAMDESPIEWESGLIEGALGQDDIYTQLSFMQTFDRHGKPLRRDIGRHAKAAFGKQRERNAVLIPDRRTGGQGRVLILRAFHRPGRRTMVRRRGREQVVSVLPDHGCDHAPERPLAFVYTD